MKLTKHKVVLYQYIPLMSFIVTKLVVSTVADIQIRYCI